MVTSRDLARTTCLNREEMVNPVSVSTRGWRRNSRNVLILASSKRSSWMFAHPNHIPQPPHSAGLSYRGIFLPSVFAYTLNILTIPGLRPRIDPTQVPTPTQTIEADKEHWEDQAYGTLPGKHAPLSTTDYIAIDQGRFSPQFFVIHLKASYESRQLLPEVRPCLHMEYPKLLQTRFRMPDTASSRHPTICRLGRC
jgi:hypothetical protein